MNNPPLDPNTSAEDSVKIERVGGWDSVPTIERVYERTRSGAILCCFPTCNYARHSALEMWRHVHFAKKHRIENG